MMSYVSRLARGAFGFKSFALLVFLVACGGSTTSNGASSPGGSSSQAMGGTSSGTGGTSTSTGGASTSTGGVAGSPSSTGGSGGSSSMGAGGAGGSTMVPDGAPTRMQCTNNYGMSIVPGFGRLDGYLVAVLPPGHQGCNTDDKHIHLQVMAQGAVYDVAVDVGQQSSPDVEYLTLDAPLLSGSWSEGWHTGVSLDYPRNLNVHSTAFMMPDWNTLIQTVENELANVNHISVFGVGYQPPSTGCHDIHWNSTPGADGAIVTEPLSTPSHYLLFHFSNQTF